MRMRKRVSRFIVGALLGISLAVTQVSGVFAEETDSVRDETVSTADIASQSSAVELKADMVGNSINYDEIIYSSKKDGLFFIQRCSDTWSKKYKIIFYSIKNNTYSEVYSNTTSVEEIFVNERAAYFIDMEYEREKTGTIGEDGEPEYTYIGTPTVYMYDFESGKADELELESITTIGIWSNLISAIGVDDSGRFFVATNENNLHLFSPSGKILNTTKLSEDIYQFCGFDSENGNFYYVGEEDYNYWGYINYLGCLKSGKVGKDNSITVKTGNMMYLYNMGFYKHKNPVQMTNGRYLAALSTLNGNRCVVLDSHKYDINDVTDGSTGIGLDGSLSPFLLNISNKNAVKLIFQTAASDYGDGHIDKTSIGSRCVVNEAGTSVIAKTDSNELTEYDISSQKEKIKLETKYPVYTFFRDSDQNKIVAVEKKDDKYYLQLFNWVYPKTFEVNAPKTMKVGAAGTVTCAVENGFKLDYTYKSSDSKIVSVDANGRLNAWKKGTATITVTSTQINVKKSITITVTDSALSKSSNVYTSTGVVGAASATMHRSINSGDTYGSVQTAYLNARSDGSYERVEYIRGYVVREIYDSNYRLVSQKKIKSELPLFGGYYCGKKYNYLVFGQINTKESTKKEVIRVVKYEKNWKRIGACQIKGANTYKPFSHGGLDMTETAGKLYIHTCHTMFQSSDGFRHQANCTFVVKEDNMKLVDSYYDVMNLSEGYVSHSFAQQVVTDGKYVYRVDLGDAYPRGIAFTATGVADELSDPSIYGTLISIPGGEGDNYTGYTLNDLKLGKNNYLLTGTGLKSSKDKTKNIYINAASKMSPEVGATWITNYTSKDKTAVMNPKLVKLNETQFLLMWEEKNTKSRTYRTKMVLLDESGNMTSKICTSKVALSMCEPVVTKSGRVVWYVTNNDSPTFVQLNPYQLAKVQEKTSKVSTFNKDNTYSFDDTKKSGYRKGDIVFKGNSIYKVTSSSTVTFGGVTSNSVQSLTIPSKVKLGKKVYKVTAVSSRALIYRTGLRKVTIGAGVKRIGRAAFYGCRNLKLITINGTSLKLSTVGDKAFKNINSRAVVKVPKAKKSAYKKILLKRGITSKMKIK